MTDDERAIIVEAVAAAVEAAVLRAAREASDPRQIAY